MRGRFWPGPSCEPTRRPVRTTLVRRRIAIALVTLCGALAASLVTSPSAEAHPLGNFTINHYAGIEVAGRDVYVRYALDVAEIPTYQLGAGAPQARLSRSARTRSSC